MQPRLQAWQVLVGGICALVLTIGLARFAYTPLLPRMRAEAGLSLSDGGLLAAINYAGYMSGALLAAVVESPRWRRWLYLAGLPLSLVATALMGSGNGFWFWALSRYLGGLCGAAGMLFGGGLVLGWLAREGHRQELGVFFIGLGLGIVVSALGAMGFERLSLGWAGQWWAFAWVGAAFIVPAWLWRPPQAPRIAASVSEARAPAAWLVPLTLAYFCAGWGFVINATFTVAIVEHQPLLAGRGPWAWLLVGLAATPAVFVWDGVARRWGEVNALMAAYGLQALGVLLPVVSHGLVAALAGGLIYGATFIGIVSLTLALVGRRFPGNPGKAMARLTMGYGVAQVGAPAITGRMVEGSGGFESALILTAAVLCAGLILLARLRRQLSQRQ